MKNCKECEHCLEKWIGENFYGYICGETYENIIDEAHPLCEKENLNEQ